MPAFKGTLDSDGYVISDLMVNTTGNYGAFFGRAGEHAKIRNVGLENANVTLSNSSTFYGAILVGRHSGVISNCYSTGSVSVTTSGSSGVPYGGGLVGWNENGAISSSYSTASVSSASVIISTAGGLVGRNENGTISSSYATGPVATSTTPPAMESSINSNGGLVGWNSRIVNNSYATGSLSAMSSASSGFDLYRIGGLTGTGNATNASLSNSYWDTSSTGEADACGNDAACTGTTGLTTAQMQAVSGTFPSGLGDGFQFTAGSYPKVKKCTVCTGTLVFSDELVPGQ